MKFLSLETRGILIGLVIMLIGGIILNYANPKDDTDPVDGRSGFRLMIDSGTGCQYLQAGYFGGMTPRLNQYGNHICK